MNPPLRLPSLFSLLAFGFAACLFGPVVPAHAETTSYSGATAITSIPATGYPITQPGTYYLAADLSINADIACAINITASNVVLDFNGHTLSQVIGTNNSTIGVYVAANNVTVRNGTVAGCLWGVNLYGNNCLFEDLFIVASTFRGAELDGANNTIRRCRVNNTGGETVPNLAPYAMGICMQNGVNNRVMDCDVTTLTPGPYCSAFCMLLIYNQNLLVVNNRVGGANYGVAFDVATGKYRDNIVTADVQIPYLIVTPGMVDAGNNQ